MGWSRATLTPAYDIYPQGRAGNEATQAMLIMGDDRMSRIMSASMLPRGSSSLVNKRLRLRKRRSRWIRTRFGDVCDEAGLSEVDRDLLWRRQFLNPFAFDSVPAD